MSENLKAIFSQADLDRARADGYNDGFRQGQQSRVSAPIVAPEVDEPHKLINFLTVLEHQAHRSHEYRPTECGECSLTKTIADRIRKELRIE